MAHVGDFFINKLEILALPLDIENLHIQDTN